MGLLRLILAIAVVVAHVSPWFGIRFFGNGVMAVECFYLISGFYMAMVLTERYRGRTRDFYFNRFIRLFPIYWALAAALLLISAVYWPLVGHPLGALAFWTEGPWGWRQIWAAFSNLAVVGCDWAELANYARLGDAAGVNRLILLQPAWSLAVEIVFYLFAPWLLRLGKPAQLGCFAAAIGVRVLIWESNGSQWSPWLYYFAPASWVFFLGGVWAYHGLALLRTHAWFIRHAPRLGGTLAVGLAALIIGYAPLGLFGFQDWRFYVLFAAALPFIFEATKTHRLDSAVAAWSYPLYLAHWMVLSLYPPLRHFVPDSFKIHLVLLASAGISFLVLRWDDHIQKRFKRPVAHPTPVTGPISEPPKLAEARSGVSRK